MKSLAFVLSVLLFLWIALLYVRVKAPYGFAVLIPRLTAGALSPLLALVAVTAALRSWWGGHPLMAGINAAAAAAALVAAGRIATTRGDFVGAFGPDRCRVFVPAAPPQARWQRDIPFWRIADSGRTLLCDIWQPPAGMVGDVKRAVAWLKAHSAEYGVDPDRIVVGGSSAGGHLAQLAGFAPGHPGLTPADVQGLDLTVRGIISCYGPSDLTACFSHTNQHRIPGVGATPPDMKLLAGPAPAWVLKRFGPNAARLGLRKMAVAGRLDWLMGGTPEQVPERYALCSPINHVHAGCPPTLLLQGTDDLITSAAATRELYGKLRGLRVPAICVIYPHTDHGFDLMLPAWSPSARGARSEIDRFLAALA